MDATSAANTRRQQCHTAALSGRVPLARSVFTHEIIVSRGKNWLDDKEENIYGLTVLQEALRAEL